VQGVIELFSRQTRPPDPHLVQMITATGRQIGRFIERKQAERSLEYQALHDTLTRLPNRHLLQERVQRALSFAHVSRQAVSLLLVDLDRFKQVNDTHGHHIGDLLLQQTAQRMQGVLRESDTVARIGGDEFAVLLPGIGQMGASVVAEKMLSSLNRPFIVEGLRLDVGASVGLAIYPEHCRDAETLRRCADKAMYAAKQSKTGYAVYSLDLEIKSPARATV
jgi:diguanylate cyclase (GGDEF)-like protein